MLAKSVFHRVGSLGRGPSKFLARILSALLLLSLLLGGQQVAPAHAAATRYAKPGGLTSGTCSGWGTACSLQRALTVAVSGDQIWVRQGNYIPTARNPVTSSDPRSVTFTLKSGVSVYGGFLGTETLLSQRQPGFFKSYLSGAIGGSGTGDNAYHVVRAPSFTTATLLDGFEIRDGNANSTGADDQGGGGVFIHGGTVGSGLTLSNLTIRGNLGTYSAGMEIDIGSPTLTDMTFTGNTAQYVGGGLGIYSGAPTLTNVTFYGNGTTDPGGSGGALRVNDPGSAILTNVTISGNSAASNGAIGNTGPVAIYDSILWDDSSELVTGASNTSFTDSIVEGGCPSGAACTNVLNTNPQLAALASNGGFTQTMALPSSSPAIDAGGVSSTCALDDQRGIDRSLYTPCDIGAYEYFAVTIQGNTGGVAATLSYTDGTPKTVTADGSGNYTITVSGDWSGTVTPSFGGDYFVPASRTYSDLATPLTSQDYNLGHQISGHVGLPLGGLSNVNLSWNDGTAQNVLTDGSGNYTLIVSDGFTGTVTPSRTGYTFSPINYDYSGSPVFGDVTGQDFTEDLLPPSLTSPADAASVHATPTFKWTTLASAIAYEFEYDDDSGFGSPNFNSGQTAVTSITPPTMAVGTYYWHVRAYDPAGNFGDWSTPRNVTVLAPLPAAPVKLAPLNGTITSDNTPLLSWNSVLNGDTYEVQISNNTSFLNPYLQDALTASGVTTYTPAALPDGKYYWRVRARTVPPGSEAGAWSLVWNFTVDTTPPPLPVLLKPLDTSSVRGTPAFSWSSSTTAKVYQFEYSDTSTVNPDGSFTGPLFTSGVQSSTSITPPTIPLLPGPPFPPYYWNVRARDALFNWSNWTAAFSVTILPPIPVKPTLSSPANGGFTSTTTPLLSWNSVPYGDTYEVQISNNTSFLNPYLEDSVGPGLTYVTSVLGDGKYYWRVRAINVNLDPSLWSTVWTFIVDTTAPVAPAPSSPIDNAFFHGTPTFSWHSSATANAYQFEYDDDPGFGSPNFISGSVGGTSFKPPAMPVGTYHWRVQARDAAGNWSGWGPSFTVTIF